MHDNNDGPPVGYKSPPTWTRFKPGQSGNPTGRPKKRKSLKAELADELDELISVSESGREVQIPKRRAIAKSLIRKAVAGDLRATEALLSIFAGDPLDAEQADEPTPEETRLLQDYVDREVRRRSEQPSTDQNSTT